MSGFIGFVFLLSLSAFNICMFIATGNWYAFGAFLVCTFCAGLNLCWVLSDFRQKGKVK